MLFSKIKKHWIWFPTYNLLFFFNFSFLNIEFNIFEIKSSIERLSNSSIIMGDNQNTYSRANYFNIPLNLIDLIFLLSFFHLILFKKSCLYDYVNKVLQKNVLSLRIHLTIIALFFISLISLIINHELFTSLQLQIQILHLFRIIEIFLILLIF